MPEDEDSILAKLRKLGRRVRQGMVKVHPPNPKHLEIVRAAVEKQWNEEQFKGKAKLTDEIKQQAQRGEQVKRTEKSKDQSTEKKSQDKSQSKDHGQSH